MAFGGYGGAYGYRPRINLIRDIIQPAQLLTNALALPARYGQAQQQAQLEQEFLRNNAQTLGIDPSTIETLAPVPTLPGAAAINRGLGGIPGKIFGGVGEVGSILSSLLGGPLATEAPRLPLSALTSVASLKATQEYRKGLETEKETAGKERAAHNRMLEDAAAERNRLAGERLKVAQSRADKAAGAPSPERDLDKEADDRGLKGTARFEWKKQQRIEMAGQKADASAAAREKYKDLPAQAQKTLADVEVVDGLVDDMFTDLEDPQVKANTGLLAGRIAARLYKLGWAQPGSDPFVALRAQIRVLGVQPYIRGTRHFAYLQQIQEHLPQAGDQEGLIRDKLHQLKPLLAKLHRATLRYATMTRGSARAELGTGGDESVDALRKALDDAGIPR